MALRHFDVHTEVETIASLGECGSCKRRKIVISRQQGHAEILPFNVLCLECIEIIITAMQQVKTTEALKGVFEELRRLA